uniref:Uncharacterized protein n=1 Tax=Klebsiella pneumoniae TaxID=573 RepID=A0A8B0SRB0_KLEPN|nr:hypothetical protein [Klebsiella pneumoniae]
MAFISQLGTIPKRSGRVPSSKFVSFRKTKIWCYWWAYN